MILDTLTKTIEIVLGEAHATTPCDVIASWGEHAVDIFLPGSAGTVTNGVTPVTVVDAPVAVVTQRLVQEITLHNADTIDHTVTLRMNDAGTMRIFRRVLVKAGGDFSYAPSVGVSQAQDAASYFSIVPGAPDILVLQAPSPDNFWIYSGGGYMDVSSPNAATGASSGDADVYTGDSDIGTGAAFIYSGSNTGTGNSGDAGAFTGIAASGNSGAAYLQTGDSTGTGNSGNVKISTGIASIGASGDIDIASGSALAGNSGHAFVGSANASADSGGTFIGTGDSTTAGTTGGAVMGTGTSTSGKSGDTYIYTGDANGANAGAITLAGGWVQSGNGNGCDITITPGTGHGTGRRGLLVMDSLPTAAPAGVSHAVWEDTSTTPHTLRITP